MKKFIIIFLLVASPGFSAACPTCVGRLIENAPVFFNDELYVSTDVVNFDDLEKEEEQSITQIKENQ